MPTDRRRTILFVLYALSLFIPLWDLTLIESTEARYGEIAREMLASGNFLEPTFNGIYHFHKPPVPYWLMAAGMAIFGINDFGVRFFGVIAAAVTLLFTQKSAAMVLGDRDRGFVAAAIMGTSLLFLSVSRVVSTDIYLTAAVSAAQYFLFRQAYGTRSHWNPFLYGISLGIGFMIKGPVVFLFTLLPHAINRFIDPQQRNIFTPRDFLAVIVTFSLVSLPWYVAVTIRHPELFSYFTKTQTVDRVATDRFARNKPLWYFPLLFPATFLPWTVPFLRTLFSWRRIPPRIRALIVSVIVPLAVFSLAKSKLPPYILPFYGIAAMAAAHALADLPHPIDRRASGIFMFLAAAVIGSAGFLSPPLRPIALPLAGAALGLFAVAHHATFRSPSPTLATALFISLLSLTAYAALPYQQNAMKAYRSLVEACNARDPGKKIPIVVYRGFLPSLSFYRGELAVMAMGRERETLFQKDDRYRRWYLTTEDEVRRFSSGYDRIFVVSEPVHIGEFQRITSTECSAIAERKRYTAHECRVTGAKDRHTGEEASSALPSRTRR